MRGNALWIVGAFVPLATACLVMLLAEHEPAPMPHAPPTESQATQEPAPQEPRVPRPREATIRGRCVAAAAGTALAGARITVRGEVDRLIAALHEPLSWHDPEPVAADASGCFAIHFVPAPAHHVNVSIECAGCAPRSDVRYSVEPGEVIDLGDVALAPGRVIEGVVVDSEGGSTAGVHLTVGPLPLRLREQTWAKHYAYAVADAAGRFTLDVPLPLGTWSLAAYGETPMLVVGDGVLEVRQDEPAAPVTVRVRMPPASTISGQIVDELGAPVGNVRVCGYPQDPDRMHAVVRGRADGTFTLRAVGPRLSPVSLLLDPDPEPFQPWAAPTLVRWGTRGLRFMLLRAPALELTVVERESGRPVERFAVRCAALDRYRLGGWHAGGRVTVDRLAVGPNELTVVPADAALERSEPVRFVVAANVPPSPLRVELSRKTAARFVVCLDDGTPVSGTCLELYEQRDETARERTLREHTEAQAGSLDAWVDLWEDEALSRLEGTSRQRYPRRLGSVVTDAEGRATLWAPCAAEGLRVRALGPGHARVAVAVTEAATGGASQQIRVERGGRLVVSLAPSSVLAWQPELELSRDVPRWTRAKSRMAPAVLGGGTFAAEDLAPGEWTVTPLVDFMAQSRNGARYETVRLSGSERRVRIERGRTTEVALDAASWAPAALTATVTLDGAVPPRARVMLLGKAGDQSWSCGAYAVGRDGRVHAERLPPGSYSARLQLAAANGTERGLDSARFTLAPGQAATHELRFPR